MDDCARDISGASSASGEWKAFGAPTPQQQQQKPPLKGTSMAKTLKKHGSLPRFRRESTMDVDAQNNESSEETSTRFRARRASVAPRLRTVRASVVSNLLQSQSEGGGDDEEEGQLVAQQVVVISSGEVKRNVAWVTKRPAAAARSRAQSVVGPPLLASLGLDSSGVQPEDSAPFQPYQEGSEGAFSSTTAARKRLVVEERILTEAEYFNLQRVFRQFDTDRSETIDADELSNMLKEIGMEADPAETQRIIAEITGADAAGLEGDGKKELEFDDFLKLVIFWKDATRFRLFDLSGATFVSHIETSLKTPSILSDSRWRWAWDTVVMFVVVYLLCCGSFIYTRLTHGEAAVQEYVASLLPFDVIACVIMLVDVFVWGRTAFLRPNGHLVSDRKEVLNNYLTDPLIAADVLAVIPWWQVGAASAAAVPYLVPLAWFKAIRLWFMWAPSNRVPIDPVYIHFHFNALPILTGICSFLTLVHISAVIAMLQQPSLTYTGAVYYAVYVISGVGFGDTPIALEARGQRWYTSFLMLCSMVINGYVVGNIVQYIQVSDIRTEKNNKLRETSAICKFFKIPRSLEDEVLQFQEHVLQHKMSAAYFNLIKGLPDEMKVHIGIYARLPLLTWHPVFSKVHQGVQIALAQMLETVVFCPEELLFQVGDDAEEMFFVAHGFLDAQTLGGANLLTMKPGHHCAEASLAGPRTHIVSVKALTYCDLFLLSRGSFHGVLERFPHVRRTVEDRIAAHAVKRAVSHKSVPESARRNRVLDRCSVDFGATSFPGGDELVCEDPVTLAEFAATGSGNDHMRWALVFGDVPFDQDTKEALFLQDKEMFDECTPAAYEQLQNFVSARPSFATIATLDNDALEVVPPLEQSGSSSDPAKTASSSVFSRDSFRRKNREFLHAKRQRSAATDLLSALNQETRKERSPSFLGVSNTSGSSRRPSDMPSALLVDSQQIAPKIPSRRVSFFASPTGKEEGSAGLTSTMLQGLSTNDRNPFEASTPPGQLNATLAPDAMVNPNQPHPPLVAEEPVVDGEGEHTSSATVVVPVIAVSDEQQTSQPFLPTLSAATPPSSRPHSPPSGQSRNVRFSVVGSETFSEKGIHRSVSLPRFEEPPAQPGADEEIELFVGLIEREMEAVSSLMRQFATPRQTASFAFPSDNPRQ